MCEAQGFFPAADIFIYPHLENLFFLLIPNFRILGPFLWLYETVPYTFNQGCCPYLTGFLNSSGHLPKWHLDSTSLPHHELIAPICTHSLPAMKLVSPTRCFAALFNANFPPACHLRISPHSYTHAYIFSYAFLFISYPSMPGFFLWTNVRSIFLRYWRQ